MLTKSTRPADYYNYDSSIAFNYSSYPVGRFANEFGYHSMPSLQTWQQAVPPSDLYFNSTTIELRNHHYPPGGLNISNFPNTTKGMGEMTIAAERWYPVRATPEFLQPVPLTIHRYLTRPTASRTSPHGVTRRRSSKPTSTNPRYSSTGAEAAFPTASSAPCTGS